MSLSSLTSSQLQRAIELLKEKEMLEAKLADVAKALDSLQTGEVPTKSLPPEKRGRRRMKLKDAVLKKLAAAGKAGLTVKELAASLKAKPTSVSVWFYTTGKKIKGIKKVGTAKFAYSA
jgi:hypothetical protein